MPVAFLIGVNWGLKGVCLTWIIVFPFVAMIVFWASLRVIEIPVSKAIAGASVACPAGPPSLWPYPNLGQLRA